MVWGNISTAMRAAIGVAAVSVIAAAFTLSYKGSWPTSGLNPASSAANSQASNPPWRLLAKRYDDGGISGASLERRVAITIREMCSLLGVEN